METLQIYTILYSDPEWIFFYLCSSLKVIFLLCYQPKKVPKAEIEIFHMKAEKTTIVEKNKKHPLYFMVTFFHILAFIFPIDLKPFKLPKLRLFHLWKYFKFFFSCADPADQFELRIQTDPDPKHCLLYLKQGRIVHRSGIRLFT